MSRQKTLPKVLSNEETDSLLSQPNRRYFTPHRDYLMMRVMLMAGLRVGEVTTLRPSRVDLQTGKTNVIEGKGAKDRNVWLSDGVLSELRDWSTRRVNALGSGRDDCGPSNDRCLFPTQNGTTVDPSHLRRSVTRYARQSEIKDPSRVSPHTLRHTFATRLYKQTGDIRMVQKALGHTDVSTTMIYTHIVDDDLSSAMRSM
jgi:site-specific recombinase XerD